MKRRRTRWRWRRLAIRVGWLRWRRRRRRRRWRNSKPLIAGPARICVAPTAPPPTSLEDILDPQGNPHNGWVDL